jgi:protein-disulfide isomerase
LKQLAAEFPEVRVTFQQFPLPSATNPWAMQAALYSECSAEENPASAWKFIDAVFDNQDKLATMTAEDQLTHIAASAGLDAGKISSCAGSEQALAAVRKSIALGQALKVTTIPTLFINGRRVANVGGVPYDQLKNVVKFEIENASR